MCIWYFSLMAKSLSLFHWQTVVITYKTNGCQAGVHHGIQFPNRVMCVDKSEYKYRHMILTAA